MNKPQERVLIVDDDSVTRGVIRAYLEKHHYAVEEAESGNAAIALLSARGLQHGFNLVILDQMMPGFDGLTTLQKIKKIAPNLPAIMLTGCPSINLAVRFIQLGGTNIISKPFDPQSEVLATILHEAINYSHIQVAQAAASQEISNDPLLFLDDNDEDESIIDYDSTYWKVLVVDDDVSIHRITKLALDKFLFDGKTVSTYSTYSALEAKEWLNHNPNVAIVIVDSTLETVFAGFDIINHIRKTMGNRLIRIIFRTEQKGDLPEQKIVLDQEIDGFLTKDEIASQRLTVMVTTILRAYRDLLIPERQRQEKIAELKIACKVQQDLKARITELEQLLSNTKPPN